MKTENGVLTSLALDSLEGKWALAVGTFVVYMLILIAIQAVPVIGSIASLFIAGPFALGASIFTLSLSRNWDAQFEQIFQGFNNFATSLGAYLLMFIFILLWILLLIIPGIIASLSYSMTFFIIADNPSIGAMEAIDRSKSMMNGYKWKLFCLYLRFLGWALLCLLTLGLGFFLLIPYIQVSIAKFYDDVKGEQVDVIDL